MSHTVANVPVGGRAYIIDGPLKTTITDVTLTTASEVVTAAELGLNAIQTARATIQVPQATNTGVTAPCAVSSTGSSITLTNLAAAGTAATVAAATVVRVEAKGY